MLQWRAISGISVFQIEWPFRGFVQICCLVSVVLQNLALPMDWTSGFARGAPSCSVRTPLAGCGARAGMPAVPRHGIGPLGPTRPDFWDVWQRDDALKCSLGVPSGNWLACWRGGLSLLETGHIWIDRMSSCKDSMLQRRSLSGIFDFQIEWAIREIPWVCLDLLCDKYGLAKSCSTHGLNVWLRSRA